MKFELMLLTIILSVGVVLAQTSFTPVDSTQAKIISMYDTAKSSPTADLKVKAILLSAANAKEALPDAKLDYVWHYGNMTVIDGTRPHTVSTTTLPPKPTTTTLKTKGGL